MRRISRTTERAPGKLVRTLIRAEGTNQEEIKESTAQEAKIPAWPEPTFTAR